MYMHENTEKFKHSDFTIDLPMMVSTKKELQTLKRL